MIFTRGVEYSGKHTLDVGDLCVTVCKKKFYFLRSLYSKIKGCEAVNC